MADADASSCGCCTEDPKSNEEVVRELLARREALEKRLASLEAPVLVGSA